MSYSFFAMMARMKYIERWALMRNSQKENISEHSLEVAMFAHGLAIIGNEKCGRSYNAEKAALIGLYHDATEIITGDMPTPVKYYDENIQGAYKRVEKIASLTLMRRLPEYMQKYYHDILMPDEDEAELMKIVKAADKMSALVKCIEEEKAGNKEFATAYQTILKTLRAMEMPEVDIFLEEFVPEYRKTLDELI